MKLPDFFKFESLNGLKARMGIPHDVYGSFSLEIDPGRLTPEELDRLTGEGLDVYFNELTILPDGTLAYKDSRVLLYIRDVHIYGHQESEPRYHLFNCTTLLEMSQKKRFDRYVISTKINGIFKLNIIKKSKVKTSEDRRLSVCQNCLDGLGFKGFNLQRMNKKTRGKFVAEFVPDHFFEQYPRSLHVKKTKYDSETAPRNEYPSDFPKLSERLRRENGWQCQKCKQNLLPYLRQYLHVHHINGDRSDNTPQNLKILCIACHAKEPNHSHMRNAPAYAEFIRLNRTR
jgi:hypothetical protein